jgi:hypothetical protein
MKRPSRKRLALILVGKTAFQVGVLAVACAMLFGSHLAANTFAGIAALGMVCAYLGVKPQPSKATP